VLRAPDDLHVLDARALELAIQRLGELGDELLAQVALLCDELRERLVLGRLDVLEREVLELPPHLRHAEAVREGGVEVHRLLRDAPALLLGEIVERAHVVEAVRELDQDDADILRDREQELPVVLDLALLARLEGDVSDLRDAVHDRGDLLPELGRHIGDGDGCVLDHIVNEPAGDGARVEMQLGQDLGDFDAVMEIRRARGPLLPVVRALAELEGARDEVRVESLEAGVTEIQLGKNRFERWSRHRSPVTVLRAALQPNTEIRENGYSDD